MVRVPRGRDAAARSVHAGCRAGGSQRTPRKSDRSRVVPVIPVVATPRSNSSVPPRPWSCLWALGDRNRRCCRCRWRPLSAVTPLRGRCPGGLVNQFAVVKPSPPASRPQRRRKYSRNHNWSRRCEGSATCWRSCVCAVRAWAPTARSAARPRAVIVLAPPRRGCRPGDDDGSAPIALRPRSSGLLPLGACVFLLLFRVFCCCSASAGPGNALPRAVPGSLSARSARRATTCRRHLAGPVFDSR